MRLRILDWNSRWFWFVCFFRKDFSGSVDRHLEINLYGPQKWSGTWFHFWMWEKMPDMRPQAIAEPQPPFFTTGTVTGSSNICLTK